MPPRGPGDPAVRPAPGGCRDDRWRPSGPVPPGALRTSIGLLDSWLLWGVSLLVLAAAVLGKGVACAVAARLCGESPRDAAAIGALMNARGLMELILLNIAYERGVISQTLFTMLVLMAVVTTLMAVPAFHLVHRQAIRTSEVAVPPAN